MKTNEFAQFGDGSKTNTQAKINSCGEVSEDSKTLSCDSLSQKAVGFDSICDINCLAIENPNLEVEENHQYVSDDNPVEQPNNNPTIFQTPTSISDIYSNDLEQCVEQVAKEYELDVNPIDIETHKDPVFEICASESDIFSTTLDQCVEQVAKEHELVNHVDAVKPDGLTNTLASVSEVNATTDVEKCDDSVSKTAISETDVYSMNIEQSVEQVTEEYELEVNATTDTETPPVSVLKMATSESEVNATTDTETSPVSVLKMATSESEVNAATDIESSDIAVLKIATSESDVYSMDIELSVEQVAKEYELDVNPANIEQSDDAALKTSSSDAKHISLKECVVQLSKTPEWDVNSLKMEDANVQVVKHESETVKSVPQVHIFRLFTEDMFKKYGQNNLLAPFMCGWKRELVHRQNSEKTDVYYHSSDGLKLRSLKEISSYLSKKNERHLNIKNFSWDKKKITGCTVYENERPARQPQYGKILKKCSSVSKVFLTSKSHIYDIKLNDQCNAETSNNSDKSLGYLYKENVGKIRKRVKGKFHPLAIKLRHYTDKRKKRVDKKGKKANKRGHS